ncbi:dihydroxyacetone kinase subunit L [Rathayibacter sp. VKM Ac-2804]|uniref:dihydroxyacetone kinase subunit DhaL n=1 Tax=Rathayibacter sp. VKM Ac-2804 TaxID=2609257 RepID=UPI00132EB8F4|nr:dihydroxyacetone kinase subunit DhaL [Rathayibacter sp. VKM Ac-2804]QHF24757.1 dihydroxyacetone kinase subunit L [Rathayibacter sp. VKM Ac-2804]
MQDGSVQDAPGQGGRGAQGLDAAWAVAWVRGAAQAVSEHRVELITLDRAIGDGDHGENMDRGFQAVVAKLDAAPEPTTPAEVLKLVATTLISTVGGASGPLFGTAFLKASGAVAGQESLDGAAVAALLAAARDGVVLRGKAEVGDKTMVDAWTPAVEAAAGAAEGGASPSAVLAAAADAAQIGAESTDPLVARKGRASYLGERAVGHRDPGSVSSVLLLRAAAEAAA